MTSKVVQLACGLGFWSLTACMPRSPEPSAPAASAAAPTASAEDRLDSAESQVAVPAPAPPAAADGLDAPKSKSARDEAEFGDLAAAERALHQAKAELDRLALAEPSPAVGTNAAPERAEAKKESKPTRPPSAAGAPAPIKSSAVCENACRAFSSLSRAASAVCRLDGSSGTHCSHAKRIVAESQQRVASCSCPASSD